MAETSFPYGGGGVRTALRHAASRLAEASDTPRLDAELLLAHALGVARQALLIDPAHFVVPDEFATLVERRRGHEPVAYIVGWQEFWSLRFAVGPGVLIPRPDSETLIEGAIAHFAAAPPRKILDLGTGPGTLLLAALSHFPDASGLGIDASDVALGYASANAAALGLASRAQFAAGDWGAGIDGRFDLILCNPPYIGTGEKLMADVADYEPPAALFAGDDGLADYRRVIPDVARLLAPGGLAALEIGVGQRVAVTALATAAGFAVDSRADLAGRDRALFLQAAR